MQKKIGLDAGVRNIGISTFIKDSYICHKLSFLTSFRPLNLANLFWSFVDNRHIQMFQHKHRGKWINHNTTLPNPPPPYSTKLNTVKEAPRARLHPGHTVNFIQNYYFSDFSVVFFNKKCFDNSTEISHLLSQAGADLVRTITSNKIFIRRRYLGWATFWFQSTCCFLSTKFFVWVVSVCVCRLVFSQPLNNETIREITNYLMKMPSGVKIALPAVFSIKVGRFLQR